MKKYIVGCAVVCTIIFAACKKDKDEAPVAPTDPETVAPAIDPVKLSATLQVGYGTSIAAAFPTATTTAGAPMLQKKYDQRMHYAINGRYVILFPHLEKGDADGYYLKVNGASNYFKIDYKTAFNVRKAGSELAGMRDGAIDSAIVFKLPEGLKHDTFSVSYAAYDSASRVSNALTAIISVVNTGAANDQSKLAGTWRLNRQRTEGEAWSEAYSYPIDTSYLPLECVAGRLNYCNSGGSACSSYVSQLSGSLGQRFVFGEDQAFAEVSGSIYRMLNFNTSTCDSLVYTDEGYTSRTNGGYSYDAATRQLSLVFDAGGIVSAITYRNSNTFVSVYQVAELTDTKLVLYFPEETKDHKVSGWYQEFLKQ
jgi:hypothetical protein